MSGRCQLCDCTDNRACEGGCFWVLPDLCSECVIKALTNATRAGGDELRHFAIGRLLVAVGDLGIAIGTPATAERLTEELQELADSPRLWRPGDRRE
jgi:hypothetical protein